MEGIISRLVTLIVWIVANVVYRDLRRRNRRGFLRIVSFWSGLPLSAVSMIFVREGSQPDLQPPPDDEEALLEEVRRTRRLGSGADENPEGTPASPEGT